jgi:hypothetical protein
MARKWREVGRLELQNPWRLLTLGHKDGIVRLALTVKADGRSTVTFPVDFTGETRDAFMKLFAATEIEAEGRRPFRRPCCDHCNNGEGDPAGHDYTLNGPHDRPCEQCAAEKARREHDEGTG